MASKGAPVARRVADLPDRIGVAVVKAFLGVKRADITVEQPTNFELRHQYESR
jgi:hypothetical protein